MKRVWSISTTVRNPERLRNFLITLKELEDQVWDKTTQLQFQIRLIKNRYYGFGNSQFYNGLTENQKKLLENVNESITLSQATEILENKNYVDATMRGRNSYKPLEKMGLAAIIDKKVKITSLGKYLLSEDYDLGELFFKSFLKWQYPNPIDRDFNDAEIYNLKPFITTLHLINEVNKFCLLNGLKVKGISKLEFKIFGQTLLNYRNLKAQVYSLIQFRKKYESLDEEARNKFVENYIEEFLYEYVNIDGNNLNDYADNTIRYFRLTRYIRIRGGVGDGAYIDLEERRMIEINELLEKYNGSSDIFNKEGYINYISDINQPILPWKETAKLIKIYNEVIESINILCEELGKDKFIAKSFNSDKELEKEIETLRNKRHALENQKLKSEFKHINKIDEVINALSNIRKQSLKPSIALEKFITKALQIINDAEEIKANSLIGDDNEFIFTAPANKPDIECHYSTFNSICEVTMLTSRDQWYNEGQPVMRHFRHFEDESSKEENYCLFVAPQMHRDTINTFWISVKYEYEGQKQKIVPLTISQIIELLELIKDLKNIHKTFTHVQFQELLNNIVNLKDSASKPDDWLKQIPIVLDTFKCKLLTA